MNSQINNLQSRHTKKLRAFWGVTVCVWFVNCSGTPEASITCATVQRVELDQVFDNLLDRNKPTGCALPHCHVGVENPMFGNVDEFYFATVGKKSPKGNGTYVIPNDLKGSFLFQKLLPSQKAKRMPFGGPYLDDSQMRELAGWICQGAPPPRRDGGT
jgi:hypothetical protein